MVGLVVELRGRGLVKLSEDLDSVPRTGKDKKGKEKQNVVGSVSLRNTLSDFFSVLFSVCLIRFHNDLVRIDPFFFTSCFIFLDPGSENGVVPTQHVLWLYLKPTSHVSQ